MNKEKILGMLGLCTRAGKLALGDSAVKEAVVRGKAKLVIIAADCGENTRGKIENLCNEKNVPRVEFSEKSIIGKAVGRDDKAVVAITDKNFAEAVKKLLCSMETAD